MSLKFGCTRIRLDFIAIALLSFFVTSGCCINWQENVRPKLYVELGKIFFNIFLKYNFFIFLFLRKRRHRIHTLYTSLKNIILIDKILSFLINNRHLHPIIQYHLITARLINCIKAIMKSLWYRY